MAPTRTRPAAWLAAALLAFAALFLAACGSSTDDADPASQSSATTSAAMPGVDADAQELLERVVDKAEDLDAVSLTFELEATVDGEQVTAQGSAGIDAAGERGTFSVNLDAPGQLGGQAVEVEGVVSDQVLYLSGPFVTQMLGASTPWVSLPMEELNSEQGPAAGMVDPEMFDPQAKDEVLHALRGLEVTIVGDETIDGDDVTHVQAMLPLEDVLSSFGSMAGAPGTVPPGTQVDPVVVDLYVTGDDELRRVSIRGGGTDGSSTMELSLVIDLESYDTDVDVTVPPADQVTDLSAMMAGGNPFGGFGGLGMLPQETVS
jgi:hypothetical protein